MIDFHCHLDLYPDPRSLRDECVRRGLHVLSVTTTPSAWKGSSALSGGAPRIRTALGLHPQLAHERKGELPLFESFIGETRYVGEIGLDGSPEYRRCWEDQVAVFERILENCRQVGGRIMSIHSRRASSEVLDRLERYRVASGAVLHWFSGNIHDLKRAIEMGCWFSVGPAMLRGERGRALARRMPGDRMLTESDGPFTQLDGEPLRPWDVEVAVGALADIWAISIEEAGQRIADNLKRLVTPSSTAGIRS